MVKWIHNNWIIYNPGSPSTTVGVTGGGGITITATNTCGTGNGGVTIWSNCHSSLITVSPNPTTDNVNISIAQTPSTSASMKGSTTKTKIYKIKVTDLLGNLKQQYDYASGVNSTMINLSGLISGMYTIQAFDGTTWNSAKVIKR